MAWSDAARAAAAEMRRRKAAGQPWRLVPKPDRSTSVYRLPSPERMRLTLKIMGVSASHISMGRTLREQRTMLLALLKPKA